DLKSVLEEQKPLGEILTDAGLVSQSQVGSALAEQTAVREARTTREKSKTASSIRVGVDKLDLLVDLVGELVIAQVRLDQVAEEKADNLLTGVAEEMERLCSELRERALGLRMLPIGTTFNKFRRLARDLSVEMGKEIELSTHGAETELDKTVIEKLNDPLVHLLRNSIDHGIELPDERVSNGKPGKGTIGLFAKQAGGEVHVVIQDDGKGMDRDAILRKAVDMGLAPPEAGLPDREVFDFIFAPGFSTAKKVTDVSGRGVGMDVVKKSIDSLNGDVEIASRKGAGTTVTIRLPLTLAIIDGLQVRAGKEDYVIPLSDVEECVELLQKDHGTGDGNRIMNLRGEAVPRIPLREWFQISGSVPAVEQGVIVKARDRHVAIAVDQIVGQRQTVIKNLGKSFGDAKCFSGATIMGDGSMALILDVSSLVEAVEQKSRQ
ncbi:MAG: chemotaxis protein CheA, partial [Thermodesulfobacteriota bacterium]|nr:chemotaxis protein CheA [Thermodesulfobacteriota bacterium]